MQNTFYLRTGKRLFDFVFSLVGLVITSPLLLLGALAIWLDSFGPVFYRQWRVGQLGTPFRIIKLRTMVQGADQAGLRLTASGDARITRIGKWLRKSKMDEIPQLLNVLRGEMSLVGPRPEVPEYVATYNSEQRQVLKLKPGITGPASLAFVDEEQWLAGQPKQEDFYTTTLMARKLALDLLYCQQVNFWGDVKLIFGTIAAVVASNKEKGAASAL